jgi:hypothetical protein
MKRETTMQETSRRTFNNQAIGALLTFSALETLCECDAFADEIKPVTVQWLNEINQLGFDLKDQKETQLAWQKKVEELFAKVELPELLRLVDFDRLTKNLKMADRGARSIRFKFREIEGVPERIAFGKQIFALKKGRSVVPHGHNNMATAFLILKGDFHGRHYDRLEDEAKHMIIKPTIDRRFGPGECSTISDFKDNVHWFKAQTEPAFIFNIHVLNVRPMSKLRTGREYVDPDGERVKGGLIRARRIDYAEAHKLYG